MTTLQIGENEPFRLSHDKGHRIVNAICSCHAHVTAAMIDTTAPATHVIMRFDVPLRDIANFKRLLPEADVVEYASGL